MGKWRTPDELAALWVLQIRARRRQGDVSAARKTKKKKSPQRVHARLAGENYGQSYLLCRIGDTAAYVVAVERGAVSPDPDAWTCANCKRAAKSKKFGPAVRPETK